jgi:hypothetical protein
MRASLSRNAAYLMAKQIIMGHMLACLPRE